MNFLQRGGIDLASGVRDFLTRFILDAVSQLHAQEIGRLLAGGIERPVKLLVTDGQPIDGVEGTQNIFTGAQSQGAQENRA